MGIYLENYPGTLQPRRTAFDHPGAPVDDAVCIYMTNRSEGRWSYLLPAGFEIRDDPIHHIGMGYTQLWILAPLWVVHGQGAARSKKGASAALLPFEAGVTRDDFLTLSHVFREPGSSPRGYNDHIGGRHQLADAVKLAKAYAERFRTRTLVAKLTQDWTWH